MKIRVGMIGCGSITELRHGPEYEANKDVEIAAFCDSQPERARRLAGRFGGKAFTDYRDLLNMEELEAVSVCTVNNTHAAITIEALKAGKHVLCEKPMATNLEDAKKMIETAQECGKFLMIGHNQRLAEAHIKAKEILRSDGLGRVLSFKTCFGHGGPEMWSADKGGHTWFFKKNAASMGALGDLAIHKADLIRWLLNDEIDEIGAILTTVDKKDDKGQYAEVEDNAVCLARTRSGITGSMNVSWTYYGPEDNSTSLYCEKGILRIFSNPDYQIIVQKRNGDEIYYKTGKLQTNGQQTNSGVIDAFVKSLTEGIKPEISGEEGFEALSVVMACIESNEKKEFVKVRHLNTV